jgi:hypothetical protein
MFKRVTAILLIFLLFASSFSRFFVYAGFELNKKYIAANLCENRGKPWLHCNGKCFFMKKIKQAEQKEKGMESQSQKNIFQQAVYTKPAVVKFHSQLLGVIPIPNNRIHLPQAHNNIFRPPQLG